MKIEKKYSLVSFLFLFLIAVTGFAQQKPNILLIIADDIGLDALSGDQVTGTIKPTTPTLDSLKNNGLTFKNTWSMPSCSPSRAALISGKFGIKTGVQAQPGDLDVVHTSIFNALASSSNNVYSNALIGKWQLGDDQGHTPGEHGVEHFEGRLTGGLSDYFNWEKNTNGVVTNETDYVTTNLTNSAIDWIDNQDKPWFLWLAHLAPHDPFHVPPTDLYTTPDTDTDRGKYIAAIEALDQETGRLINSLDQETRDNTVIIFVGDNGTPKQVVDHFDREHGKGSLYEGGLRVPLIISGKGVTRINQEEEGLVQITDLYATILEISGAELSGGVNNSLSLNPFLTTEMGEERGVIYTDYENRQGVQQWAIKNERYKLIENENGNQEFYDLSAGLLEENNLINNLSSEQEVIKNELADEAQVIRTGWSCKDGVLNGDEEEIDVCETEDDDDDDTNDCENDNSISTTNIGCCDTPDEPSVFYEFIEGNERKIYTNVFPNHAYCYNPSRQPVQTHYLFGIDRVPTIASETTSISQDNGRPARYYGVAKNGILMIPTPATPFIFENPNTGEYNWDWVYEANNNQGDGRDYVALDCSSAHTGQQGYHYHGNMFEYMETILPGITTATEPLEEAIHIGWASDGFPIVYRFGPDENGVLKELQPGFKLKEGERPGDGITEPCGTYNGKYIKDYEFNENNGDLDECNGVARKIEINTSAGLEEFDYFYVVTSTFPQIGRCLVGTPSPDFENSTEKLTGVDEDGDGFLSQFDCDDTNPLIHPLAEEIEGNTIDENCDNVLTSLNKPESYGLFVSSNASGNATVKGHNNTNFNVDLVSENGRKLKTKSSKTGLVEFNNLRSGLYILSIQVGNNPPVSSKVVVK